MLWSLTMQVYSTNTQNVRRGGRGLLTAAICTQAVVHTGAMINGCTSFQFSAFQLYFILVYTYTVIFLRINFVTFCKMFCLFFNHFCAYNSRKKLLNIITYEIYFKNQLLSLVSSCGYAGIKHGRKNITIPVRVFSLQWSQGL